MSINNQTAKYILSLQSEVKDLKRQLLAAKTELAEAAGCDDPMGLILRLKAELADHPVHEACPKCLANKRHLQRRVEKLESQLASIQKESLTTEDGASRDS